MSSDFDDLIAAEGWLRSLSPAKLQEYLRHGNTEESLKRGYIASLRKPAKEPPMQRQAREVPPKPSPAVSRGVGHRADLGTVPTPKQRAALKEALASPKGRITAREVVIRLAQHGVINMPPKALSASGTHLLKPMVRYGWMRKAEDSPEYEVTMAGREAADRERGADA